MALPPPVRKRFIFKDTIWLGGTHDGYPLSSFDEYSKIRHGTERFSDHREIAAQRQSHLTFGLLEAVMEIKIPESTLLRRNDRDQTVMTSEDLPQLLRDWRYRIKKLGNGEECRQWAGRVQTTLMQARAALLMEITMQPRVLWQPGIQSDEMDGILCLVASIGEELTVARGAFPWSFPTTGLDWTFISGVVGGQWASMLADGWCPFAIHLLSGKISILGYASTCRPYIRETPTEHDKCTTESCIRNTIDTSNYTTKHTTPACDCENLKPSLEIVVGCLSDGKIPVILTTPDGGLGLGSDSSQTPYVAVSHVWADGLGSTTEGGLPACQIRRLAAVTAQLVPGGAFWMDALCIPEKRDMRKRAIGLMARTYRDATAVLVVDAGIRSCLLSAPLEEKLLRIVASGWMQRLWTLQEAVLAKKLVFEFADGFLPINELLPVGEGFFEALLMGLASEIYRLVKYRQALQPGSFGIADVSNALSNRTSSRIEDETLAISGLLDVDAFELVNLSPEQRMKTFLLRVEKLPPSIIFMSGARLDQPGFRWAPRTLMQKLGPPMGNYTCVASCTPDGLVAEYATLYFTETRITGQETVFFHDFTRRCIYGIKDPTAGAYSFTVILAQEMPTRNGAVNCAAVFVKGKDDTDDGSRMICEFKKKLILTHISEEKMQKEMVDVAVQSWSGRMRVRIV